MKFFIKGNKIVRVQHDIIVTVAEIADRNDAAIMVLQANTMDEIEDTFDKYVVCRHTASGQVASTKLPTE